ncbi:MAG: hypothetical protein N3G80_01160 [Candidatus Micrarchaeota archaeon]|nr:hypothetical protein [Candidatus Micrarchaeota archaeon]
MRTLTLVGLLVVFAVFLAIIVFSKPSYPLTESDAKKFFLEDLKEKYPNADVREIIEILFLTSADGMPYYQLKARVTHGLYTPCPERIHVYYDYPPKNFVAQPPEYITKGCSFCLNEPNCIVAFPEEAIIASHKSPAAQQIANFIKSNSDAKPEVMALSSYRNYSDVWLVKWNSISSNQSFLVVLSKAEGRVLEIASYPS